MPGRAVSGRSVADSLFRPHPEQRARASREPKRTRRADYPFQHVTHYVCVFRTFSNIIVLYLSFNFVLPMDVESMTHTKREPEFESDRTNSKVRYEPTNLLKEIRIHHHQTQFTQRLAQKRADRDGKPASKATVGQIALYFANWRSYRRPKCAPFRDADFR